MPSTTSATISPDAVSCARSAGLKVARPARRKTTLKPASSRPSDTKPSASIARATPKVSERNAADASGSATVSERADAIICIRRTEYNVHGTHRNRRPREDRRPAVGRGAAAPARAGAEAERARGDGGGDRDGGSRGPGGGDDARARR